MTKAIRTGLIGSGIQSSASPAMHMQEARQNNLDLNYELFDLDRTPEGPEALRRVLLETEQTGFAGVNITHPCKQRVIEYLNELSDEARAIGAVNTVVFSDGRRIGYNTDCYGFAEGFRRGLPDVPLNTVTQLGAGGAGSAVAYAILKLGAGILNILDTDHRKAVQLTARLAKMFGPERVGVIDKVADTLPYADGLINSTPVGMAKYPGMPISASELRRSLWVAEIIYFPLETALLKAARACGCRTIDGAGMVVFQAAESFFLFTGLRPDTGRMLRWFREHVTA